MKYLLGFLVAKEIFVCSWLGTSFGPNQHHTDDSSVSEGETIPKMRLNPLKQPASQEITSQRYGTTRYSVSLVPKSEYPSGQYGLRVGGMKECGSTRDNKEVGASCNKIKKVGYLRWYSMETEAYYFSRP